MSARVLAALVAVTIGAIALSAQRGVQTRPPTTPPRTIVAQPPVATSGSVTIEQLELAADRLAWERSFYPPAPPDTTAGPAMDLRNLQSGPSIDLRVLTAALMNGGTTAASATYRKIAVRALGRMQNPKDIATLALMLGDTDASARAMTAWAIAQCLWNATDQPQAVKVARIALEGQLIQETDKDAKSAMFEALGSLHYTTLDDLAHLDLLLRTPILPTPMMDGASGALVGLEALTRRHPGLVLNARTITRLRELAVPRLGGTIVVTEPDELNALRTLQNIHDDDVPTIAAAASWHCNAGTVDECGYKVRLVGVQMMSALDEHYAEALDHALHDGTWQVRYEALTKIAQVIAKTQTCAPLIEALDDRVDHVVRHAVELLDPRCAERTDLTTRLKGLASQLGDGINDGHWQIPATALETLVKFDPDTAHKLAKETAATSQVWQVRVVAAQVAGTLYDEDLALALARHEPYPPQGLIEANVRIAALKALRKMSSTKLADASIDALSDPDDELVYTAALMLKTSGRRDAMQPLLDALTRLSKRTAPTPKPGRQATASTVLQAAALEKARDSSRDARLGLLNVLQQLAGFEDNLPASLRYLLTDTDPIVASTAANIVSGITGTIIAAKPTKTVPIQPSEGEIVNSPRCARMLLDNGGQVDVQMEMADAPIAAARFLTLATNKFYDGLTFHRVDVNNFVQAGSPDANELSTGDSFIRDEIYLPVTKDSLAFVTHGADTAAGQFFIPLFDRPGLNRDFTVFAHITNILPPKPTPGDRDILIAPHILEGMKITSIRELPCNGK